MQITAVVPLKGFADAKERLSPRLTDDARIRLASATAARVVAACVDAGLQTIVVSGDREVKALADSLGATPVPDPGSGLDGAVRAGIPRVGHWVIVHGDLPLLDASAVGRIALWLEDGWWVLAPALDGGTNVLAGHGPFETSFGPGSFHRHLARVSPRHRILVGAETAVEIDTPSDLSAAALLPGGEWLRPFLS